MKNEILEFIKNNKILRVAFSAEPAPYIVPVNYGYDYCEEKLVLFFHGAANKGRKYELSEKSPMVGFEIDNVIEVVPNENACNFSMKYQSVVGTGRLSLVTDSEERIAGLNRIMWQISGKEKWDYNEKMLKITAVYKVEVDEINFKKSK